MQIPEEMEKRLRNWGRWARQGRTIGKSPLQSVIRELALEGAAEDDEAPINVLDAELVNNLWRRMPCGQYEDRKVKAVLAMTYCSTMSVKDSLRVIRRQQQLRIRPPEVDQLLEIGLKRFAKSLGYAVQSA